MKPVKQSLAELDQFVHDQAPSAIATTIDAMKNAHARYVREVWEPVARRVGLTGSDWDSLIAFARYDLDMSEKEFWALDAMGPWSETTS